MVRWCCVQQAPEITDKSHQTVLHSLTTMCAAALRQQMLLHYDQIKEASML
jgi:hypothetical protein